MGREDDIVTEANDIAVFTADLHWEGAWVVAQAVGVDVATQGESQDAALANLREALELYFMPNASSPVPPIDVRVS